MKKTIAATLVAALLTACAIPVPVPSDTFRNLADKVQGIGDFEATGGGIKAQWLQAAQRVLVAREPERRYTHAGIEFRDANGRMFVEKVKMGNAGDRDGHYAMLNLRTIGQHDLGGQACGERDCIYLGHGEYAVRVVMYNGQAPMMHLRLGSVTVDVDRVTAKPEATSAAQARRG